MQISFSELILVKPEQGCLDFAAQGYWIKGEEKWYLIFNQFQIVQYNIYRCISIN